MTMMIAAPAVAMSRIVVISIASARAGVAAVTSRTSTRLSASIRKGVMLTTVASDSPIMEPESVSERDRIRSTVRPPPFHRQHRHELLAARLLVVPGIHELHARPVDVIEDGRVGRRADRQRPEPRHTADDLGRLDGRPLHN